MPVLCVHDEIKDMYVLNWSWGQLLCDALTISLGIAQSPR